MKKKQGILITEDQQMATELLRIYKHISAEDFEEIMESLDDKGFLSKKGQEFRSIFWDYFIRE